MRRIGVTLVCALVLALQAGAAAAQPFPSTIALPNGFAPEGIAAGAGTTFYAGSVAGNGIYRGNLRTGAGAILVPGGGTPFTGMKTDAFGRLWVSGAGGGTGYVFDASTGAEIASFTFTGPPTFVNDVVITPSAAYFTDSFQPVVYRVPIGPGGAIGAAETIDLSGQFDFVGGGAFNLNGIDASPDGQTLIAVNSTTGALVRIDPASETASEVDLGGTTLTNGDGILLVGPTLYVVQNQDNRVAVVRMAPGLRSGSFVDFIRSDGFNVPTTLARFGSSLYVVNAEFGTPVTPTTPYWVTRIDR